MSQVRFTKTAKKQIKVKVNPAVKPVPAIQKHDVIFDIMHLKKLMNGDNFITEVSNYLNKFFLRYGSSIFFDNGETFECLTRLDACGKIPDEYKRKITYENNGKVEVKEISLKSYFGSELFLKTPETKLTIDYDKDMKFTGTGYIRGFDHTYNYLNMKKELPRDYTKQIIETDETRAGVKMFFDHILHVICSDDPEEFEVVTKFLASSCVGHKLKIALVWQSGEQAGKGTVLNKMKDLLGKRAVKTSSMENIETYTKIFEGATLINLDEVPVSGSSKTFQDKMKALITEDTFDCRAMYNQAYIQKNTFNLVVSSNNNSISCTQSSQIRMYVNTINDKFFNSLEEKKVYFDKLYSYINREDISILIFQEFVKIYNEKVKPTNWLGNDVNLMTKAGKLKRIEALPLFYKYIKDFYLLKGKGINEKSSEFLSNYQCINKYDKTTPNKLGRYLGDIGVELKKISNAEGRNYIISYEDLRDEYIKRCWIDELIDDLPDMDEPNPLDANIDLDNVPKPVTTVSLNAYNELMAKYEDLLSKQPKKKPASVVAKQKKEKPPKRERIECKPEDKVDIEVETDDFDAQMALASDEF